MSTTKTFADKLKAAPSVSDVSGKRLLVIDANGNPNQAPLTSPVSGLNADKLTSKQLTNEDLNTITWTGLAKDISFQSFWANSTNTCANKPNGVGVFHLNLYVASSIPIHILTDGFGNIYKRSCNSSGNWSSWKKMLTEDDITSLVTRIAALEAKVP